MALTIVVAGCAGDTAETTHEFTVEIVDGVEEATNRGGPKFAEPLFTIDEGLTLRQMPDVAESLVHQPTDFARGADGRYYVADTGNNRIAVFDAAGNYSATIGNVGQGPGEFEGNLVLIGAIDGEVRVFDRVLQRTQVFTLDGALVDAYSVPTEGRLDTLARTSGGGFAFTEREFEIDGVIYRQAAVLGLMSSGGSVRRVATESAPFGSLSETELEGGGVARVVLQIPFSGDGGGFRDGSAAILVDGTRGLIEWLDMDGTVRRRVSVDREPVPVNEPMKERVREHHRLRLERDVEEGRTYPAPVPDLWFPDTAAWWRSPRRDDRGYFWFADANQQSTAAEGEDTRYEIFSPDGEYLGAVHLAFTDFRVQDGMIFARDRHPDTDEARLRVFRLDPVTDFAYH